MDGEIRITVEAERDETSDRESSIAQAQENNNIECPTWPGIEKGSMVVVCIPGHKNDHMVTSVGKLLLRPMHSGIYVGENQIVHLEAPPTDDIRTGVVIQESVEEFLERGYDPKTAIFNPYDGGEDIPYPTEVILKNAKYMASRGYVINYDFLSHNCEHVACELRYGKRVSIQVRHGTIQTVAL